MGTTLDQRVKFIHTIYNDALMASASTGIPVKAILAQAALETGWGTELLAGTNNLFNIKADLSWEGSSATFNVLEFEKGERVYRDEDFRVYSSYEESFEDWVDFLQANPRYADCFSEESLSNDANFVNALAEAGYATDPHYAAKLMSTINGQSMRRALASLFESVPNYEPAPSFVDINDLYGLPDMLAPWIDLFDSATRTISPLVLDLDGDGVETIGLKDGAYFDHDGNGFSEQTGCAGRDDGLLVLDRDGDGIIENGTEVFGNQTVLQNGRKAANGFQALSEWDGNADGRIDNNDSAWNQLKIWRDTDGDGYSSADELHTLEELGIQSISTVATGSTYVDDSGNEHRQVGTYTKTDGTVLTATDVWFQTETAYTIADEWLDVPEDILNLPDLKGYGNTYDLHQAMVRDSSGQLRSLLEEFVQTTDITARNKLMDQILFKWTGSEDIASNSKGNCIDAKKLAVLETLFGRVYTGGLGPNAVSLLEQSYLGVKEMCYAQLMVQTHLKDVCDMIVYSWDEASQSIKGDLSAVAGDFQRQIAANPLEGKFALAEFVRCMGTLNSENSAVWDYDSFRKVMLAGADDEVGFIANSFSKNLILGSSGGGTLNGTANDDAIAGGGGNDAIYGNNGADVLYGNNGADTLYGNDGDDILDGGAGDDYLNGNAGSDTYRFGIGSGADTIDNYGYGDTGVDTIEFGAGTTGNIDFVRSGNDLRININGTTDSLTVQNWFSGGYYIVDQFRYADGTTLTKSQVDALGYKVYGTSGNDSALNGSSFNDTIYGYAGNDTLNGSSGDDTLDGGAGDDMLFGNTGEDILIGNAGTDLMTGDSGNDTYIFSLNDGNDTVTDLGIDTTTSDRILFTNDVLGKTVALFQSGQNLVIGYGASDVVTVSNQASTSCGIEKIELDSGLYLNNADINTVIQQITAFATANGISLTSVNDVRNNQDLMNIVVNSWHS